jgi:N-acyl-D-aspartate/D-glutamate deacylase
MTDFDLLIRHGTLYDGTGAPGQPADLGVCDGRIVAIGPNLPGDAPDIIDAAGLAVCPGFIDIKTHSDFTLPLNPRAESKVRQGVTTEIIGHCGFSCAPVLPGKVQLLQDYLSPSAFWLKFHETSFPAYLDTYPATSVNAGMLVGHNTLRLMVMGMANRPPTTDELAQMADLLDDALAAGALGLSSGLFTAPGSYADAAEMRALCAVAARHNAGYFTHLRDEAAGVLTAVDEAIDIAETCGIHVQIVHFKCSGADAWGQVDEALARITAAKSRGLAIDLDAYPYTAGSNRLKNLMPQWVQAGGVAAMVARLRDPQTSGHTRAQIAADIARDGLNNWGRIPTWDAVQVLTAPHLPALAGRTIGDLATERGADPIDVVCDTLVTDEGATRVLVHSIREADVQTLVASPLALVGSDGNCVADHGITSQAMAHPRFYGTFPKILGRYVHEMKLLPLEHAIHKMTGATAAALNLRDRGLLKPGWRADITIFDPNNFVDRSTYSDPHQYPTGDRTTVLVNGVIVVRDATHTGALPGHVLRRATDGKVD